MAAPKISTLEFIRHQAKEKFDKVKPTWIECGHWALPHETKWMLGKQEGSRVNNHIVDTTHILALRSYVAGFLEGNTSASRPWYKLKSQDPDANLVPENKEWLDIYTRRTLNALASSNYYSSAGRFYAHFGTFNTGAHYIDELKTGLYFHNLTPGSYFVLNDGHGNAIVLVREFTLSVKALVETYGRKVNGNWDWSNFSQSIRDMYEKANYAQGVDIVHVVMKNDDFDPNKVIGGNNRQWVSLTYEIGTARGQYYSSGTFGEGAPNDDGYQNNVFLKKTYSKRKPFIIGRADASGNFEYGEKGPTLDALGLIKSLNKKALGKDQALEQMLKPALQGPANLKKSYITTASNSYIPLDANALSRPGGGLRTVFEINPAIGSLIQDVTDLRTLVDKLYYADYLLYLSRNPKTRTATETNAILQEQQLIIGPNLQSLNWTYNVPTVEFVMDYVLDEDPHLPPPPEGLTGQFLSTEFISVFAQAQRAADLPSIDSYIQRMMGVGQIDPSAMQKINFDKYADLLEDRLYLPPGLNREQSKVDALREQAQAQAQQQQMMQETLPAVAGAAKDIGLKVAE